MTVTLAGNPGNLSAWESSRYTATVNGVGAMVYGRTQDMHLESGSPYFVIDTPSEQSILKFTYDEAVTIVISSDSDPITSAVIYPQRDDVTLTVANNEATITLPVDADGIDLWFDHNGDRQNPLHIFAQPVLDGVQKVDGNGDPLTTSWLDVGPKSVSSIDTGANTITTGTAHGWSVGQKVHYYSTGTYPTADGGDLDDLTIYFVQSTPTATSVTLARTSGGSVISLTGTGSGTQTIIRASWSDTSTALVFPAGEHRVGMLFDLADDVEVYFEHGSVALVSFDLRATDGVLIHGPGVISGTFADPQSGAPFGTLVTYAMFYGNDNSQFYFDNRVEGVTTFASPAMFIFYGLWSVRNVQHISPWEANTDGPDLRSRAVDNQVSEIVRMYVYTGDDCVHVDTGAGLTTIDKSFFIISANGSPFIISYTYDIITDINGTTWDVRVNDCHAMTLAGPDPDTFDEWPYRGFTAIFKAWIDSSRTNTGRWGLTFNRVDVWGPLHSRPCSLQNLPYEFVGEAKGRGQFADVEFNEITFHEPPGQQGVIEGLDENNRPQGIHWKRLTMGGVPVSVRNFGDYFDVGEFVDNVTVDGRAIT